MAPRSKQAFEKQDRAARLVRVLHMLSGTPNGITADEIGHRTDRNKRTALRDLHALEVAGVPVYQDDGRWFIEEGYHLKPIAFTQPETMALLIATRLAVQHIDYRNEFLAMALDKLATTLPAGPVKTYVGESASQLAAKPEDTGRQKVFSAITTGLLEKRQLRFRYRDPQNRVSTRTVHPYFIEPVSLMTRGTYLVAKDIDKRDIRTFKLDRISDARVLAAGAYVPSDVQLEKLVADSWGIWMDARVEHIELVFSAEAAPRARETRWHPSQHVRSLGGGRLRMTLDVRGVVEITPWVLSWGADVEVVGPPALRQRVTEAARRMAARYGESKPRR